jgi:Tfp pilus assembly protein PilF
MQSDVDLAKSTLEESISAKKRSKDAAGMAAACFARGNFSVAEEDYGVAVKWCRRASVIANKYGLSHVYALSKCNESRATDDAGDAKAASALFSEATRVATDAGDDYVLRFSLNGEASAAFNRKAFARAAVFANRLLELAIRSHDVATEVQARHMLGVEDLRAGRKASARNQFATAVRLSRRLGDVDSQIQNFVDSTRTLNKTALGYPDPETLTKVAQRGMRGRRYVVASKLWKGVAEILVRDDAAFEQVDDAFEKAESCLTRPEHVPARLALYRDWYIAAREAR